MLFSRFSLLWFLSLGVTVALAVFLALFFRSRSEREKRSFIGAFSIALFLFWILYKVWLYVVPDFEFEFWSELPFHLCNIAMPIAAIGAYKNSRVCQGICYFCCSIGAVFALLLPVDGFYDVPFLTPQGIGYWGYHFLVLLLCVSFVLLGVYHPRLSDIPKVCLTLFLIACGIHALNLVLRATVYAEANYCYTFGLSGNPVTEFLCRLIPVPLLYLLPCLVLLMAVDLLLLLPTRPWKQKDVYFKI